MMWLRYRRAIVICLTLLLIAGCPKISQPPKTPPSSPESAVLLKYKFPKGRIVKYRTKSESRMKFTIPFITDPQQVRSESDVTTLEEVIQEPIQGYALVEQRIEGFRFILYQGDRVVFDSARAQEFPPQPQFDSLLKIKGAKIHYQVNELGEIRRVEGLDNLSDFTGSANASQVYQNAQPTFLDRPVAPGESWKSSREIPLAAEQGFSGSIIISDETKLIEVRMEGNSQRAVIELVRNVSVSLESATVSNDKKSKLQVAGKAESVFTIIFDLERGIIIQSDGRVKISTTTAVSDQPNLSRITMDVESVLSNSLQQ